MKEYYKKNKEEIKIKGEKYRKNNKEKINKQHRDYYKRNPDKFKETRKKYAQNNKKIINKSSRKSHEKYKDKAKIRKLTRKRYGKLPKGKEYHHYTIPYHVDKWVIVSTKEHGELKRK